MIDGCKFIDGLVSELKDGQTKSKEQQSQSLAYFLICLADAMMSKKHISFTDRLTDQALSLLDAMRCDILCLVFDGF